MSPPINMIRKTLLGVNVILTGAGAGDGDGRDGSPNEIVMIVIFISTTVTWNHPHQNT